MIATHTPSHPVVKAACDDFADMTASGVPSRRAAQMVANRLTRNGFGDLRPAFLRAVGQAS